MSHSSTEPSSTDQASTGLIANPYVRAVASLLGLLMCTGAASVIAFNVGLFTAPVPASLVDEGFSDRTNVSWVLMMVTFAVVLVALGVRVVLVATRSSERMRKMVIGAVVVFSLAVCYCAWTFGRAVAYSS